jgi:hypothetical protein
MKTVAIMTMIFLPATFYAALFAVPSLQWDQPTIIGDRFWIGISHREMIWERLSDKNRKAGEKLDREKIVTGRFDAFAGL